jgi:hypothetical protein
LALSNNFSFEAWQIAERGSMKLHMADIHLHRARLFRDKSELSKARALIEACGYWRRKEELEDPRRRPALGRAVDGSRPTCGGAPQPNLAVRLCNE